MIFAVAAPLKTNYVKFIMMHVFIIIVELFERQNGRNTGCLIIGTCSIEEQEKFRISTRRTT